MNIFRFLTLLVVFSFVGLSQRKTEQRFASQVSPALLKQRVRELVVFGNRLGGTASGDKAAQYVKSILKASGLRVEQFGDTEHLAYTQQTWTLHLEKPSRLRGLIQNDWPAVYSPSTKLASAKLRYWNKERPLSSVRVDSAIVLVQNGVSEQDYNALVEAGARAVITFTIVNSPAYSNWAMIESLPEKTTNRIPLFCIPNVAGKRLVEELADSVDVRVGFSNKSRISKSKPKTVVATIPGKSSKYFLVCAHGDGDSGGPGADDNASGVSGVLELARVLHSMIAKKEISIPTYSLKFAVWGSEYASTSAFVQRNADSLKNILAVINFDEIGTGNSRNCVYFEGNDIAQNEHLLRLCDSIAVEYVGKPGFWSEATTNPSQGGTDSYVFLPDFLRKLEVPRVEIPSITVYTAAWNEPKILKQTKGWSSKAWHGPKDSVVVDYSLFYHSSLDVPKFTTEREPYNMARAVKAVGIVLLRSAW